MAEIAIYPLKRMARDYCRRYWARLREGSKGSNPLRVIGKSKGSEVICMIYWICYVGSLPFLRITGTYFSKCITERMMRMSKPFNPSEWIRHVRDINGHYTITYTNTHTQLEKMEATFTHEQQAMLQAEQVKLYRIEDKQ